VSPVFTKEGWAALRGAWLILVAAIVAAALFVAGSHWYGVKEKRDSANASHRLQEAHARVDGARRERDNLNESADVFRMLVDRGLLQREQRLDLVEMVNGLRSRYQLFALDYEIAPQRPLPLPGGRVFPSVDVLASRVKLRAKALHEGDILGFIDELSKQRQGFHPVDECTMRRNGGTDAGRLQAHVEADCTLEWITLKDKGANRAS
jgi:hypothetical protein